MGMSRGLLFPSYWQQLTLWPLSRNPKLNREHLRGGRFHILPLGEVQKLTAPRNERKGLSRKKETGGIQKEDRFQ